MYISWAWSLIGSGVFSLRKLPCDCEVSGYSCKEMPVIPVDIVVDRKRIIRKMEGRGGEAQKVADKKIVHKFVIVTFHGLKHLKIPYYCT
jgi:hypothetical protein